VLCLQHNIAVCEGVPPIHRVVRSLGKGLETLADLVTYEVASQVLKLVMRQTREIISHTPRLTAHFLGGQAAEGTIASRLSLTNKKKNALLPAMRSNGKLTSKTFFRSHHAPDYNA
jgi:hypothetical protein